MKANKIIAIIMAALLAAITFASCSGGGDTSSAGASGGSPQAPPEEPRRLPSGLGTKPLTSRRQRSQKKCTRRITPARKSKSSPWRRTTSSRSSTRAYPPGQTSGLPSIVLIEDYKAQNFLSAYPDAFEDLTDIVDESAFMDYKFAVNKIDDKIYGVPFDSGVAGLFYRTDYVEQAGYKQEDMQDLTWEKYIEIGKAVKEKTGHAMLTLDPSDIGQIRIMMQSAGSWYVKEDGQTVDIKDNQALKDGITVYKAMLDAGIVEQVSDWDSFVSAFQSGKVASVPTGCWIGSSVIKAEDQSGKWGHRPDSAPRRK